MKALGNELSPIAGPGAHSLMCVPGRNTQQDNITPSNEYSGLISFRTDWLDLLAIQETLKSLLQHHSSKEASILWPSAFFIQSLGREDPLEEGMATHSS